jgi:hypothetical protein
MLLGLEVDVDVEDLCDRAIRAVSPTTPRPGAEHRQVDLSALYLKLASLGMRAQTAS